MNRNPVEIRASENQSKFIQDRITQVERHFGDLCEHFGAYVRKTGKLRDKGDDVVKTILNYAENASLNGSSKHGLTRFSQHLSAVEDYRNAEVKRLDAKVVAPLSCYGTVCKNAREDLKVSFQARDKEHKTQKQLEKVREKNPSDRQQISQAETQLAKASVDASRTSKNLEEQMDTFEERKLKDLKNILTDFVKIEMMFHAKALEMLTEGYRALEEVNEEEDLEEFRNSLRPPSAASRLEMVRAGSKTSLNTTTNSVNRTPNRSRRNSDHQGSNKKQNNTMLSMDADDDDDDDDDEDEESEDEEEEEDSYDKR